MSTSSQISSEELKADLNEHRDDANLCRFALGSGVYETNGKSIQDRLEGNEHFIKVIIEELKKRGEL